ncbi:MAG TPA: hypothetical protein VG734_05500 [Lacunisphaera sp.]|nr:hypothetical protein [Lacunisphaera sp.]
MKRSYIITVSGLVLLAVAYLGLPSLFTHLQRRSNARHVEVSTANVAAIHIATGDPETTLMVSEHDGIVSVIVTKMKKNGDYADGRIYLGHTDLNLGLVLSQKREGVVTIFDKSDGDGFPEKKSVSTKDGIRSYQRRAFEWIEVPPKEKTPNQSSEPTAASGRGSP